MNDFDQLNWATELQQMKDFFVSGATRSYNFRRQQMLTLKKTVLQNEVALHEALYEDLKKSPEEAWVSETGFLIAEINHAIKHLDSWMKKEKIKTNLLNFPSKSFVYKEPLGLVLIVGPWNYPLHLLLVPLVGAIAAGNCAVLKPSEFAPATSAVVKQIIDQNFGTEYIRVVEGNGSEIIPAMMNSYRFDHVFFTGGLETGRKIYKMAAEKLVPVTLELGGKSPCVVERDANIKVAAKRIAVTKFSNAGQMCVAPDYVLVHQSVKNELIEALTATIKTFFGEDASASYNYGKIINERQFNRLLKYLQQGTILFGGKYDAATHHLQPTLIEDAPFDAAVMGEEIFGPVLPILSFSTFEEAKNIINRNPDPLAFYVFTESKELEKKWIDEVRFGGGCVNNASWHLTNYNLPFGGRGNSGIGHYHGKYSFDLFSHQKSVMKTPTWFDPAIKYPPFKGKLKLFKRIIR